MTLVQSPTSPRTQVAIIFLRIRPREIIMVPFDVIRDVAQHEIVSN